MSLLAGLDLVTGVVHARVEERHRSREFVDLLKQIDATQSSSPERSRPATLVWSPMLHWIKRATRRLAKCECIFAKRCRTAWSPQ